ncbi:hypothetical protein [Prochlorococcus marinus]|uniref:hypothetical protein n=1 Tax=Prochlorococcus marinus TaxID=1219 RepID=UPI0022B5275F|nr:hypothetical protein [Prochlorococcus marinus]
MDFLNLKHVLDFSPYIQHKTSKWLQTLLVKGLIGKTERQFSRLFTSRQPICLVISEESIPLGFVALSPENNTGTCWSISQPRFFNKPKYNTVKKAKSVLLKSACSISPIKSKNLIAKSEINDKDHISNLREIGFQPLSTYTQWLIEAKSKLNNSTQYTSQLDFDANWESLNQKNINQIWRLEQVSETSSVRMIINRDPGDVGQRINNYCGALVQYRLNTKNIILGLILQVSIDEDLHLKLVRDLAFDSIIKSNISYLIKKFEDRNRAFSIEVSNEDIKVNEILKGLGFKQANEYILLGKSTLKRIDVRKLNTSTSSINKMIEKLNPRTPPLPSPSLEPR